MALYELLRVRDSKSNWLEFHTKQALWFGFLTGGVVLLALLWPLLITALFQSIAATIAVYSLALLIDIVVLAVVLTLAIRYSRRAARGEMFEIPYVVKLTRTLGVRK